MENWLTGLSLLKSILEITMGNANASKQDVRRVVQEELRTSQNSEHSEILREILRATEVSSDRREEEMNLKAKVEELTQKLEKIDHEKKSSETRMWMKDLLEKMILAGAERRRQYKEGRGGERGRGNGRPPRSYRPNHDPSDYNDHLPWTDGPKGNSRRNYAGNTTHTPFYQELKVCCRPNHDPSDYNDHLPWTDGPKGPNHDPSDYNDHLPWTDGPKGGQNHFQRRERVPDDSFVFVNRGDINFNPRGRSLHRGGFQRNRGQFHHSANHVQSQQGENIPQQNNSWRGHNSNQQRGNYRGQNQGAIPKNSSTRTPNRDVRGNQGTDEIQQLTAKLMNFSTNDVPLSLTREEVLALKNAIKGKNISENQQIGKPKKLEQEQEQEQKKKNKNKNKNKNKPQVTSTQKDEDTDATEKPSSEVLNSSPHTTPSQAPVEMLPIPGFNDSLFHLLPANQVLEDAMLVAKEGGRVITLQPRNIQEMKDFKSKYPSAELYALKPSGS
ncbi:putative mediator of RNA polymerase II transcription subunit 29 [Anabrus simplex]|uniref:putative mediator of RNA polymerase II transcription subunit 29 n=1 Tax=Anabrus simplex TaxID=316456 RepID=UPI0035A3D215